MRLAFITLFPDLVRNYLSHSVPGRAQAAGRFSVESINPRDFTYDRHQKVDDTPYGGEPGMLIKAEPVALAIESLRLPEDAIIINTDPTGETFTQNHAIELAGKPSVTFLCGHYEGIDDRVVQRFCTHRFSIGDYILTGGELASLVMADAILRNLPGVLGSAQSLAADSHADGLLSAPNYTRPEVWRGMPIPPVLKSGDHAELARYRAEEAKRITQERRPHLYPPENVT